MKNQKFCTGCGTKNRSTAKICIQCGQAFKSTPVIETDEQFCPECGIVARADANFCRQCGYRFEAAKPAPISIAPEPPLVQKAASGVELPPVAELPVFPDDLPEIDDAHEIELEDPRGTSGILLTQEELKQLRKAKPDEPIPLKTTKKPARRKAR
jgi:ribosomal protein L40E